MPKRPPYEPQKALATVVKALREEKGLNQKEFAGLVGLPPSSLSRIESGQYDPSWGYVRRVAAGLQVSLGELEEAVNHYESSAALPAGRTHE